MSISNLKRKHFLSEQDEPRKHPRLDPKSPTAASNIDINKFPYDIRLQIYEWVVGNRTIHVRSKTVTRGRKDYTTFYHHTCRCPWSETEIYNACAKPDASPESEIQGKTFVYPHKLCSHCPENCSHLDHGFPALEPLQAVDLSILATSSEAMVETRKLFYSTNTFSFDGESLLKQWLPTVPRDMKPWVRSIHLEAVRPFLPGLRKVIARLPTELPNLKRLHISIVWFGFVTCRRLIADHPLMADKMNIPEIFRPLRQLQKLKTFTVVMHDVMDPWVAGCPGGYHDEATHDGDVSYSHANPSQKHLFWDYFDLTHGGECSSWEDNTHDVERRKELCRVWAEEIRDVVLSPEVRDGKDSVMKL